MFAAFSNENVEVVALLVKAGAKVNDRNKYGLTPLMIAAGNNRNPGNNRLSHQGRSRCRDEGQYGEVVVCPCSEKWRAARNGGMPVAAGSSSLETQVRRGYFPRPSRRLAARGASLTGVQATAIMASMRFRDNVILQYSLITLFVVAIVSTALGVTVSSAIKRYQLQSHVRLYPEIIRLAMSDSEVLTRLSSREDPSRPMRKTCSPGFLSLGMIFA